MPRRLLLPAVSRGAAAGFLAAAISLGHGPALAQRTAILEKTTEPSTRAEESRAKREAKAIALVPERRTKTEAILYKVDEDLILHRIFNPPRGFHVRAGGIGEGGGFGGGAGYQYTSVPALPSRFARSSSARVVCWVVFSRMSALCASTGAWK